MVFFDYFLPPVFDFYDKKPDYGWCSWPTVRHIHRLDAHTSTGLECSFKKNY